MTAEWTPGFGGRVLANAYWLALGFRACAINFWTAAFLSSDSVGFNFSSCCQAVTAPILSVPCGSCFCSSLAALRDAHFRIGPIDLPQGFANFAHSGVGAHCVHDVGHGVG